MLHTLIGFIFVLLSIQPAEASQTKQHSGWRCSALSMGGGTFGGDFRNSSCQAAERLATKRCQIGNPKRRCTTISIQYHEDSHNPGWLVGMQCRDQVFLVTGPSHKQATELMWKLAYQGGYNPKVDCDLRPEKTQAFSVDSIFD